MLSRVASSIYWMARYVERAENLARFIDVTQNTILDHAVSEQWEPLVMTTGDDAYFKEHYGEFTSENVRYFLTFDRNYPSSIISSLSFARENARTVREAISSEAWESLNSFYLYVKRAVSQESTDDPYELYNEVKRFSHLFSGIFDGTMSRDKGWYFANIGRFLERADKTSRILDVKYFTLLPSISAVGTTPDDLLWSAVLRSVSGFEMFRKRYHTLTIERVIDFLILDHRFPRAITYCIQTVAGSLGRVGGPVDADQNEALIKIQGLLERLNGSSNHGIVNNGVHEFIDCLQLELNSLGESIAATYFASQHHNMQHALQTQYSS